MQFILQQFTISCQFDMVVCLISVQNHEFMPSVASESAPLQLVTVLIGL